jgi:phosphoglycerate kinase
VDAVEIGSFELFKNSVGRNVEKTVIVRVDLNLPSHIRDLSRIYAFRETVAGILDLGLGVVIISHYKRPTKEDYFTSGFSLARMKEDVSQIIGSEADFIGTSVYELSRSDFKSNLTILENLRFYEGEEMNDPAFARQLASLGDYYVNEAFSVSHRAHASVCAITDFLPSFAGISFEREIAALSKITDDIRRPYTAIIGGAKVSSKIDVLKRISQTADNLIIAGAMANTFLIALSNRNSSILGHSLYERNCLNIAAGIYKNSLARITLPVDFMCSPEMDNDGALFSIGSIPATHSCFDIGQRSIENMKAVISNSKTVLWSGALGAFEFANFNISSNEIARTIAEKTTNDKDFMSLIGGGETIASIGNYKKRMSFVSTAGGAFLEYIAGSKLFPRIVNL